MYIRALSLCGGARCVMVKKNSTERILVRSVTTMIHSWIVSTSECVLGRDIMERLPRSVSADPPSTRLQAKTRKTKTIGDRR